MTIIALIGQYVHLALFIQYNLIKKVKKAINRLSDRLIQISPTEIEKMFEPL